MLSVYIYIYIYIHSDIASSYLKCMDNKCLIKFDIILSNKSHII